WIRQRDGSTGSSQSCSKIIEKGTVWNPSDLDSCKQGIRRNVKCTRVRRAGRNRPNELRDWVSGVGHPSIVDAGPKSPVRFTKSSFPYGCICVQVAGSHFIGRVTKHRSRRLLENLLDLIDCKIRSSLQH